MALTKEQKQEIIKDLEEKISKQKSIVFIDFSKINSKKFFELRNKLKKAGCLLKVSKKTLLKIAFEKNKISLWDKIKDQVPGQLALIFEFEEENKSPKITYDFSKENENLKFLGGLFKNNFITAQDVINLAKLPGRQELLAQLVRTMVNPISGLANVLRGNLTGLVCVLSAIKK